MPEPSVEPARDLAGELHVLALIIVDRDVCGVVGEDVGGHQDGVERQRSAHQLRGRLLGEDAIYAVDRD
jgi:hypothetical protein